MISLDALKIKIPYQLKEKMSLRQPKAGLLLSFEMDLSNNLP